MKYYFRAFKNYAKCDGRATRKEYWWFILFHNIVVFALSFLDGVLGFYSTDNMTLIYMFASACPSICLQIRRLHDVGMRGTWWWIGSVPILNLYLLYLNLQPSVATVNAYGYPPNYIPSTDCKDNTQADNSKQTRFCHKCGYEIVSGSDFCSQCGTKIVKTIVNDEYIPTECSIQKFPVCIFDMSTHNLRKEIREVNTTKFPPSKFADNNTYYAIETIREGKKVRVYHTKNNWDKQIEDEISKTEI